MHIHVQVDVSPMKIDSTTVQLVLAVAEEGSISRAADRLNLAVAAASRRVTELEQQCGTQIFQRVPHGTKVTDAGRTLLEHIRQIDSLILRLKDDAAAISQGLDGHLLIGAPKSAMIQFLAGDIARITRRFPDITIQLVEENSKVIQQMLRDRVIDIGIYEKTSGFMPLDPVPYREDRLVLVYDRLLYPFPRQPVPLDDILDLPIISLGKGSAILTALQRAYQSRGRPFQTRYVVSGFDTMLTLVREGLGVGLIPPRVLARFQPRPALASAEIEGDWHLRQYMMAANTQHAPPLLIQNVMDALRDKGSP